MAARVLSDILLYTRAMKHTLVLFEDDGYVDLLPLVFWRSVFELQVGRKILLDRTAQRLGMSVGGVWTRDWLAAVSSQRCGAPCNRSVEAGTVLVNGRWLVDDAQSFPKAPCVGMVDSNVAYIVCNAALAKKLKASELLDRSRRQAALEDVPRQSATGRFLTHPWDIVSNLGELLGADWRPADSSLDSDIPDHLIADNRDRLHLGEQSRIHPTAIVRTDNGPVYISIGVEVGPYSILEGPLYIGPNCRIHPYTWLHGGNALGPVCRVAGELVGCLMHSYVNKQHAGFLGHTYVGSWVNIGAGATNSNLKNTYGKIRVPLCGKDVDTGLQFFGAVIGDHAKIGINATIPTGAAIGMAASVNSSRVAPKYVPSFGWVTDSGTREGDPLRLLDAACAAMARRNMDMTDEEVELYLELGARVRTFESPPKQG